MIIRFYYCNPKAWYKQVGNTILKIGENTSFGHFAIGMESFSEEKIYEAVFPKYQKSTKSEWLTHYDVVFSIQWTVPEHLRADVYEFLESFVGTWYGVDQILLIALTLLFKPFDWLFNTAILNGSRAMICTEVGSRFAEKFWGFVPTESHDKFGLTDSEVLGRRYEDNVKWTLQP